MSLDSLPDCVVKCLQDQAESIGCNKDDVPCLCDKEVSGSNGPELSSCVLSECPAEDMLSVGMDMLSFCDDITPSSRDDTAKSTETLTRSLPSVVETSGDATASAASTMTVGAASNHPTHSSDNLQSSGSRIRLSAGAKAGIGLGAALGVVLLLLGAFLLGRRRQRKDTTPVLVSTDNQDKKQGAEMEGERWVPELDAQKNQIPAELECPNTK